MIEISADGLCRIIWKLWKSRDTIGISCAIFWVCYEYTIDKNGGAGFIGSNFVRYLLSVEPGVRIVNLDALTYAGNLANLTDLPAPDRHVFIRGNVCDDSLVRRLLREYDIDTIVHFAAETHVDRSIYGPSQFIQTNIVGTFTLLEAVFLVSGRSFSSHFDG